MRKGCWRRAPLLHRRRLRSHRRQRRAFREPSVDQPALVALPVPRPYGYRDIAKSAIERALPDAVGLLCLRPGREGGTSLVSNAVRAHNRLVADRPELAAALYEPLPYDFRGEQREGGSNW